jgi:hypothetical protein
MGVQPPVDIIQVAATANAMAAIDPSADDGPVTSRIRAVETRWRVIFLVGSDNAE